MRTITNYRSMWGERDTAELSQTQWMLLAIPAAALGLMAVLQIISFTDFRDWLDGVRIGWPTLAGAVIIICELVGALSLLRIKMRWMMRSIGIGLGILVSGFWFIEQLHLATSGAAGQLPNSGLFGKYLAQSPGWWTVLETTILLFSLIYAAEILKWLPGSFTDRE